MKNKTKTSIILGFSFLLSLAYSSVKSQNILLDKPVRAGELTLFQELGNEKAYYYIVDKPRIAADENGNPQFSFLRYVENVRSGAEEAEAREGEGGGIVHALIELGVTDEQIAEARKELQRVAPGATIKGPVVYREGTIALISSFAKPDGELTKQVIGLGKAPLLDGQRAAISVQLTKQGAKILWESFKTPTPDFSVSFEMGLSGYRSPKRALIEADFEQIYQNHNFQAGVATQYLAAEIKIAYEELTKQGAIKVTQVGEDANLEKIMETAYNKILDMMFQPAGGTGTPGLGSLVSGLGNTPSMLDRATSLLKSSQADANKENEKIKSENAAAEKANAKKPAEANPATANADAKKTGSEDKSKPGNAPKATKPETTGNATEKPPMASEAQRDAKPTDKPKTEATKKEAVSVPSFAVALSYEMKTIKQHGKFTIDLYKYTTDNITLRFDKNFGNINCKDCFRQVNLDDPLYKQRELVAFVDGANAEDFGTFINFVNVLFRKTHQSGEITNDELRIDRNNFNKEGNNFKLMYGWKGDNDRSKWLDYEYKTIWSFFGGTTIESDWIKSNAGALALAPPFLPRQIDIEADPDLVNTAGVRSIDVKLYYKIGDQEQNKTITMLPSKQEFSKMITIVLPKNETGFDYEVSWLLKGNIKKTAPKTASTSSVIFVDEIPE
jgi:hypothetical protein